MSIRIIKDGSEITKGQIRRALYKAFDDWRVTKEELAKARYCNWYLTANVNVANLDISLVWNKNNNTSDEDFKNFWSSGGCDNGWKINSMGVFEGIDECATNEHMIKNVIEEVVESCYKYVTNEHMIKNVIEEVESCYLPTKKNQQSETVSQNIGTLKINVANSVLEMAGIYENDYGFGYNYFIGKSLMIKLNNEKRIIDAKLITRSSDDKDGWKVLFSFPEKYNCFHNGAEKTKEYKDEEVLYMKLTIGAKIENTTTGIDCR